MVWALTGGVLSSWHTWNSESVGFMFVWIIGNPRRALLDVFLAKLTPSDPFSVIVSISNWYSDAEVL